MSNFKSTSNTEGLNSAPEKGDGILSKGERIGEACVLERRLDWPWLMDVWMVRINGDEMPSVAGIIPQSVTRGSTVYADIKATTLRLESVNHPFILPVRRWVEDEGNAAIVSAHAEARGLKDMLRENERGFFEVAEIKEWVAQLGRALDDAHAAGLVHGWLSMQDLVVTPRSDLMVANFGITRMLASAGVADERMLAVASPQAMAGEAPSVADDVYGLGSVIFELVTGTPVFGGPGVSQKVLEEMPETMQARREKRGKVGEEIAPFWEEVVAGCLSKDVEKRPKRAGDVARLLGIGMKPRPIAVPGSTSEEADTALPASGLVGAELTDERVEKVGGSRLLGGAVEDHVPPRKGNAGKWALAAMFITLVSFAYLFSSKQMGTQKPVVNPVSTSTAQASPVVQPIAVTPVAAAPSTAAPTPVISPSPGQTAVILPENLPSLESLAHETPSAALSSSASPVATPSVNLAFNQTPQPALPTPSASPSSPTPEPSPTPAKLDQAVFTNSLGMKFVAIGDVKFSIWETRVRDFTAFADAAGLKPGLWKQPGFAQGDDHPIVYVSWEDAMAFCKWLTQKDLDAGLIKTSEVYRLPTDLEWSHAVGLPTESGDTPEIRDMGVADAYPWGRQWPPPPGAGNYTGEETGSDVAIRGYSDGFPYTSPVGSFQPNAFGLYDMGGNAWEWCMDFLNPARKYRVLRGGSWYNGALKLSLLSSCRVNAQQDSSTDNFGFRVVLAPINSLPPSSR